MKGFWSQSMHLCKNNNFIYYIFCDYKMKNKVPIRVDFWISTCSEFRILQKTLK